MREELDEIINDLWDLNISPKVCADRFEALYSDKWISVEERLPGIPTCLVSYKFGVCEAKFYQGKFLKDLQYEIPDVTHWQPLPSPPKSKQ